MLNLVPLLPALDKQLIELLEGLTPAQWQAPTVAKLWQVKDVAAHLLDGNVRPLSAWRDGHMPPMQTKIESHEDLLAFLNGLNAEWVQAFKRVSPNLLVAMLKLTGPMFYEHYAALDPMDKSIWAVAWAGETESKVWMHTAREYTEKFLHQQQIRQAVAQPEVVQPHQKGVQEGLMNSTFFTPFLQVCMYALPHTLRHTQAPQNSIIEMHISGPGGGSWWVQYNGQAWQLCQQAPDATATARVQIPAPVSWKLFSKSWRPEQALPHVTLEGNQDLCHAALKMVPFMA